MLFHLKFDQESNTKGVGDFLNFPILFTSPHLINCLGDLTFCKTTGLLKLYFWTDCSGQRKMKSRAVSAGFFPWVEYQKLGKLSHLSISYLFSLIRLMVLELRNFEDRLRRWILFLDRTAAEWNSTFGSQIGWNSESLEYHHGRKLYLLFDSL
jgi:hypothetical protein